MPKVESGGQDKDASGEEVSKDLFEDELEEALCVFKSGGANSDLLKDNDKQILFYVDLENEEILSKEKVQSMKEEGGEADGDAELGDSSHPMLINQYPLCKNHSLFLLFAEESLP
jgi:hypothetical protein